MSGSSSSHFLICSCNARLFLPSGFTSAFLLPSITQLIGSGLSPCGIVGGLSASSGLNSSSSFRRFWSSGHVDAFSAALAILTNHCQHRLPSRHEQRCGCGRDGRSLSRRCSGPREDGPLGCRGQPAATRPQEEQIPVRIRPTVSTHSVAPIFECLEGPEAVCLRSPARQADGIRLWPSVAYSHGWTEGDSPSSIRAGAWCHHRDRGRRR